MKRASFVARGLSALGHAAYWVINAVVEHECHFDRGGTWGKGKGFDTLDTIGPGCL